MCCCGIGIPTVDEGLVIPNFQMCTAQTDLHFFVIRDIANLLYPCDDVGEGNGDIIRISCVGCRRCMDRSLQVVRNRYDDIHRFQVVNHRFLGIIFSSGRNDLFDAIRNSLRPNFLTVNLSNSNAGKVSLRILQIIKILKSNLSVRIIRYRLCCEQCFVTCYIINLVKIELEHTRSQSLSNQILLGVELKFTFCLVGICKAFSCNELSIICYQCTVIKHLDIN